MAKELESSPKPAGTHAVIAKSIRALLGSAIVALVVGIIFAGISLSGVQSMNAALLCFWIAFGIYAIALLATAVIYCPNKSGTKSALATVCLVLLLAAGLWGKVSLGNWLKKQKALEVATNNLQPPSPPKSPTPPMGWQLEGASPGGGKKVDIHIKQSGSGNTANPGTTTAPVHVEPCGVFQNGGSNNTASTNCGPPPLKLTWHSVAVDPAMQRGSLKRVKFLQEVTVESNILWTPVFLKITCDGDILGIQPHGSFLDMSRGIYPNDNRIAVIRYTSPTLSPQAPVEIFVWSDTPITVQDVAPVEAKPQ